MRFSDEVDPVADGHRRDHEHQQERQHDATPGATLAARLARLRLGHRPWRPWGAQRWGRRRNGVTRRRRRNGVTRRRRDLTRWRRGRGLAGGRGLARGSLTRGGRRVRWPCRRGPLRPVGGIAADHLRRLPWRLRYDGPTRSGVRPRSARSVVVHSKNLRASARQRGTAPRPRRDNWWSWIPKRFSSPRKKKRCSRPCTAEPWRAARPIQFCATRWPRTLSAASTTTSTGSRSTRSPLPCAPDSLTSGRPNSLGVTPTPSCFIWVAGWTAGCSGWIRLPP